MKEFKVYARSGFGFQESPYQYEFIGTSEAETFKEACINLLGGKIWCKDMDKEIKENFPDTYLGLKRLGLCEPKIYDLQERELIEKE